MNVVLTVAAAASLRRVAKRGLLLVTFGALQFGMSGCQRKIGEIMIERICSKLDRLRVPPFVFLVTREAAICGRFGVQTMKTHTPGPVALHFNVATAAQQILAVCLDVHMAAVAAFLDTCMR